METNYIEFLIEFLIVIGIIFYLSSIESIVALEDIHLSAITYIGWAIYILSHLQK